jgi:hypothetical protein
MFVTQELTQSVEEATVETNRRFFDAAAGGDAGARSR